MEKIYFRPNAPISSLFSDLPNETIIIDEDTISETITDYQGNILAEKGNLWVNCRLIETLIQSFDGVSGPITDITPIEPNWERLCSWLKSILESRGWIPVRATGYDGVDAKCVNGQELFFEMEIDDA